MGGHLGVSWLSFESLLDEVCHLDHGKLAEARAYRLAQSSACWWWPHSRFVIVSERPDRLSFGSDGSGHCETGPAFLWRDGWGVWLWHGIAVDEQIVMRPETQTVAQIDGETNADVKAIRIGRFGWPRYLRETGAACLHHRKNEIEGTMEALYQTKAGERRLVATCPTGRVFAMGVPSQIQTCEEAQNWLSPRNVRVLSRT